MKVLLLVKNEFWDVEIIDMLKESPEIINFISSEFFKATCLVFTCKLLKRSYIIQVFCLFRITYPLGITGAIRMNEVVSYLLSDDPCLYASRIMGPAKKKEKSFITGSFSFPKKSEQHPVRR